MFCRQRKRYRFSDLVAQPRVISRVRRSTLISEMVEDYFLELRFGEEIVNQPLTEVCVNGNGIPNFLLIYLGVRCQAWFMFFRGQSGNLRRYEKVREHLIVAFASRLLWYHRQRLIVMPCALTLTFTCKRIGYLVRKETRRNVYRLTACYVPLA